MSKVIILLLIVLSSCFPTYSQVNNCTTQDNELKALVQSLNKSNPLRMALEKGRRGDGIHHYWMAQMKSFNIKQVAFVFNFKWTKDLTYQITPKKISYHPFYYDYGTFIKDKETLSQIVEIGLEETLKEEAISRAMDLLEKILDKENKSAEGKVYINLLDNENLPLLADSPEIKYKKRL